MAIIKKRTGALAKRAAPSMKSKVSGLAKGGPRAEGNYDFCPQPSPGIGGRTFTRGTVASKSTATKKR